MATTAVSLEQFLNQADASDARLEFDEGRVIEEMAPLAKEHQLVVGSVIGALLKVAGSRPDLVIAPGLGFLLDEDVLRVPDAFLTQRATLDAMESRPGNWYVGAPDRVGEVASPSDSIVDFDRKVRQYLQAGAGAVWIVFIETRHVHVVRADESVENRRLGEQIDLSDVVPDAKVNVEAIFAGLRD